MTKRKTKRDRVDEVTIYECPQCGELKEDEQDAERCCAPEVEEFDGFRCNECYSLHKDREDAENCCPDSYLCQPR